MEVRLDYYQGVVEEYLTRDRSFFVNPEFFLPIEDYYAGSTKGSSWHVDILALDLKQHACYLCEVSYAKSLGSMLRRFDAWSTRWAAILGALEREAGVTSDWIVRPWAFAPESELRSQLKKLSEFPFSPKLKLTPLEMTAPWRYKWDRHGEKPKPSFIPSEMS
jgi:hypothetical protein